LYENDVLSSSGLRPSPPPPVRHNASDETATPTPEEGGDSIERIRHPPPGGKDPKTRELYENDVLSSSGLRPSPPPPVRHNASEGKNLRQ
ncbi:hypothetical protein Gpo141_00014241, partial [Globisporangium polare]